MNHNLQHVVVQQCLKTMVFCIERTWLKKRQRPWAGGCRAEGVWTGNCSSDLLPHSKKEVVLENSSVTVVIVYELSFSGQIQFTRELCPLESCAQHLFCAETSSDLNLLRRSFYLSRGEVCVDVSRPLWCHKHKHTVLDVDPFVPGFPFTSRTQLVLLEILIHAAVIKVV